MAVMITFLQLSSITSILCGKRFAIGIQNHNERHTLIDWAIFYEQQTIVPIFYFACVRCVPISLHINHRHHIIAL